MRCALAAQTADSGRRRPKVIKLTRRYHDGIRILADTAAVQFLAAVFRLLLLVMALSQSAIAQQSGATEETGERQPGQTVEVEPTADDDEIASRLIRILNSTKWFEMPRAHVREGVVFLAGKTQSQARKRWATELAKKTRDVVAVVNDMSVEPQPTWNFEPALAQIDLMIREFVQALPLIVLAVVVLALSWYTARLIAYVSETHLKRRFASPLLAAVVARAVAIPAFLIGLYIILQISGLTRLALTVVGGTGIIGIIVGFAFRDIAENFLASVLLSIRRPFLADDFIDVGGHQGFVQNLNTRTTVLMTADGNHVQIPNATVFKSTIVNYTSNPNARADFSIAVGYEYSITEAQQIVRQVLSAQPEVLQKPNPMVLVDELGSSFVNLKVYFWFNFTKHSKVKMRSLLMRRVLRELEARGITAPDDAREIIFPEGVPILRRVDEVGESVLPSRTMVERTVQEDTSARTEGGLDSDGEELKEQAEHARVPEKDDSELLSVGRV
jgi:small conductance mechanosensitive channel